MTDELKKLTELQSADVPTQLEQIAEEAEVNLPEEEGFIRYNRAFIAKMSLTHDHLKAFYNVLKNTLLSYKGVKSRVSWCYDSYNRGRDRLVKINVRGGNLIVYLALDPSRYEGTKYRFRDVGYKAKYAYVPMQIKIRSKRGLRYAVELIADLMAGLSIPQGPVGAVAYAPARESEEALMARNLIRRVGQGEEQEEPVVEAAPIVEEPVAEEPVVEEPIVEEPVVEEPVVEEPIVEEPVVEEPIVEEPVAVDIVTADTTLSDREALAALEAEQVRFRTKGNKKAVVNIDVISRAFSAGDVVDLPALIARKLVPASTGHVKVCARGQIDKPLTIKANDFSVIAIKMILLLGGHAIKVK
ncbi:MAG: uL15 family ribosomal protein [Clostridia bacterium]|nr:uL15 family ribosomal protein [Clostridia bacterium]